MRKTIIKNIELAPMRQDCDGGSYRTGTAYLDLAKARHHFGAAGGHGDGEKVTAEWFFNTPRGVAILRDYWWNGASVLSIASAGPHAGRWLAAYLRTLGVRAHMGMPERYRPVH
jgi:hypothetical protein